MCAGDFRWPFDDGRRSRLYALTTRYETPSGDRGRMTCTPALSWDEVLKLVRALRGFRRRGGRVSVERDYGVSEFSAYGVTRATETFRFD